MRLRFIRNMVSWLGIAAGVTMRSPKAVRILLLVSALTAGPAEGAEKTARTTVIPDCTVFVDAASRGGDGAAQAPHKTIAAAIEAADPGAVICVAEGSYTEQLIPGEKPFTLAGGFQSGKGFKIRDSAKYVSMAKGNGGSFLRIEDPGPKGKQLTAVDGFEISGYSQAIYRDYYESQRFDITNNFIHGNICADDKLAGAGFALVNVSGMIKGNVLQKNSCGRGGAGFLNDTKNENTVSIENNFVDGNAGTEPGSAHGGALYFFGNTLTIKGNEIVNNTVTQWGGGLYVGAYTEGNQPTTATLERNVYRGNRAGDSGGGFFCDDGATCIASNEIYDRNCGGNVLVDGGSKGSGPTTTSFDHVTFVGALGVDCEGPGTGLFVDTYEAVAPDSHTITNAIFWGNAESQDVAVSCGSGCAQLSVNVTSSMVQKKYGDGSVKIKFGTGNIAPADPLFAAPDKGDFQLKPGSPAHGAGTKGSDLGARGNATGSAAAAELSDRSRTSQTEIGTSDSAQPATGPASASIALIAGDSGKANAAKGPTNGGAWEPVNAAAVAQTVPSSAAPGTASKAREPQPTVARGAKFMGFLEKFNRSYTDASWKPLKTVYVSPDGSGDGTTPQSPMAAPGAVSAARPGTKIHFLRGAYKGGLDFSRNQSGTYDAPVVLYAERNPDGSSGVTMNCANGARKTCFNFEAADYIAVDGFELNGGNYGVRAVGGGYPAREHSRGIAVMGCVGHDQEKDPFFSAQSDWNVWERNLAYGAKIGDGHGFYISNGSDWNIVRRNQTYGNASSDFQINADPASTCEAEGIPFNDPRCDAYAGEGEGGQGASDYMLVDGNYFHHGTHGANFTSVRRSVIRNNIFGPQSPKHNVSFWQETDNPKLGSSDNKILHNLFISTGRHGVQFIRHSTRNAFANNVLLGVTTDGGNVAANPSALLMEVDDTVSENVYQGNFYTSGKLEGREPNNEETSGPDFTAAWFANFIAALNDDPNAFTPTAQAPFLGVGKLLPDAPDDRNGDKRVGEVDLGPIVAR
jgi:hypothetical protein